MNLLLVQFGSGGNQYPGWQNHDSDVDITQPLPYADNSVDAIHASHVVEHVTPQQAWNFFVECLRILKPGCPINIAVPSVEKIARDSTGDYEREYHLRGFAPSPDKRGVVWGIIFNHGHLSTWSEGTLLAYFDAVGFVHAAPTSVDASRYGFPNNMHWTSIGHDFNSLETVVVEAIKPL